MSENSYLNQEISNNVKDSGPVFDYSKPKPLTKRQAEIEKRYQQKLTQLRNKINKEDERSF